MPLIRIGVILHVARDGLIVAKVNSSKADRLVGLVTMDYSMRRIGTIKDIIGPVNSPYALIKPIKGLDATSYVGKQAYVRDIDYNRVMRR
ncbi:H/ACA ribonucleoprotein complex subunit GAR1 [Caldivirga sp.]|uniref:H/ACA ribonucleoprotein complex subunit GAR1 n=1 Tax=Caldivirga sp. TaxID=2080243 RepID=UPI0025C5223E|nr:Gar1/Naf1 family protein [Caldivirga sp.]